jgi:hypothetical protein
MVELRVLSPKTLETRLSRHRKLNSRKISNSRQVLKSNPYGLWEVQAFVERPRRLVRNASRVREFR